MKVLIAIASYGLNNTQYLEALLQIYRKLPHQVHVVVLTEAFKEGLGDDIEQVVGLPAADPWSLPFGHKKLFAERVNDYDLFIYSEDDTPISDRNIQAFLDVSDHLREDEIAGFMRTENDQSGRRFFPEVHAHFHWEPDSLVYRGPYTFAFFSNEHSACYILTRRQLQNAIASGGFLTPPQQSSYDLLVTAATDPYTRCGFRKLVAISHLEDFLVPHLPNKYLDRMGLASEDFLKQVQTLKEIHETGGFTGKLLDVRTKITKSRYSHPYYDAPEGVLLSCIPKRANSVLSIGCGWGATEQRLIQDGKHVVGVALDAVIAPLARDRGVPTVVGTLESALAQLNNQRFDCVLLPKLLHLWPNPEELLQRCREQLSPGGTIVLSMPNFGMLALALRRFLEPTGHHRIGNYQQAGCHQVTLSQLRRWLRKAGFRVAELQCTFNPKHRWAALLPYGRELLASKFFVTATLMAGSTSDYRVGSKSETKSVEPASIEALSTVPSEVAIRDREERR